MRRWSARLDAGRKVAGQDQSRRGSGELLLWQKGRAIPAERDQVLGGQGEREHSRIVAAEHEDCGIEQKRRMQCNRFNRLRLPRVRDCRDMAPLSPDTLYSFSLSMREEECGDVAGYNALSMTPAAILASDDADSRAARTAGDGQLCGKSRTNFGWAED